MPPIKFIDFHCHLEHRQFEKGIHRLVERMKDKNVFALNTGSNLAANKKTLEQCAAYPQRLWAAIGLSPHDAATANLEQELEFISANAHKAIAIGEIGLDHFYFKTPDEHRAQDKAFVAQLELAEKLRKPVVVHSRDAEEQVIETLASFKTPGVLHFFLKPKLLQKALDAGLYLSIPTLKSKEQKKIFRDAPLERIFLETDSPYGLNTGERNEPSNVTTSYERLAEIKKMPLNEVALKISDNFKKITGKKPKG
ncbi:TPA: TatD family hydrolase [Candidatus Micrarchaeota archaeon]|nr:TatD family hydrolase [Candidatus Micrarchaeota archaeon]